MNVKGAALAVASACLCLVLAGCADHTPPVASPTSSSPTSSSSPVSPSPPPTPTFVAAAVGQCRDYDRQQMQRFSQDSPAVSCKKGHTAQTITVTALADSAEAELAPYWASPKRAAERAAKGVVTQAASACRTALNEHVGWKRTPIPMAFDVAWFGPSQQSWAEGDRALRCDAIWETGRRAASGDWTRRLEDLPATSLKGYVTKQPPVRWASCRSWTQDAGDQSYGRCSDQQNVYVTIGTLSLGKAAAVWPGETNVTERARTWCWGLVDAFDRGDGFDAHANIPLEDGWADGERTAACYLSWSDWNKQTSAD